MNIPTVGVGPHPHPWPSGDHYDPELLAHGDTRNVIDKYRYWTVEAIRNDLATTRTNLSIAIENWEHDLNIGSIVRTANAFNVASVHIIGKKHWNRRGAMVTDRYLDIYHHANVSEFVVAVKDRDIIAVDNLLGSLPVATMTFPAKCVLMFGSEREGLSNEAINACKRMVFIEQQGSTRSLNAANAAAIVMYQWQLQHGGISHSA